MTRVLLTTTSYQDTPGPHHQLLEAQGYEIVRERGPLGEERMLELAGGFDALLCGDDAITRRVLEKSLPRLKVLSKYGIGLDKIDVAAATLRKLTGSNPVRRGKSGSRCYLVPRLTRNERRGIYG